MTDSYTFNETESFTVTHARHIAAKVATDLLRFTRFYKKPTVEEINEYETELTALLQKGYLDKVIYGFHRNGKWVEGLMYKALPDGTLVADDDPGKIRPGTDVPGESFTSHLWRNENWNKLSAADQEAFYAPLPIKRVSSPNMPLENGYWANDLNYSAAKHGISRSTIIR